MKLPPLTDDELQAFLREGLWVATIATHNPDGPIRMTPLTYGVGDNGDVLFTTWQNSERVLGLTARVTRCDGYVVLVEHGRSVSLIGRIPPLHQGPITSRAAGEGPGDQVAGGHRSGA